MRKFYYNQGSGSEGEEFDDFEEGLNDEEVSRSNAQALQQSDLNELRSLFTEALREMLRQNERNEPIFAEERDFFLRQSTKDQEI